MSNSTDTMSAKLGLGTVQFGSAYGISNTRGRVPEHEVASILTLAGESGLTTLDTAPVYGDSEAVLGRCLRGNASFRIVTKTSPIASTEITDVDVQRVADEFEASLKRLGVQRVYGLLVHHAAELARKGGDALAAWLAEVKARGLASKVGFSCYTVAELEAAMTRLIPDLVQLPCNVLDRRFLEGGHCARLRSQGAEVHARSIFLQGVLLLDPEHLPSGFKPYRPVLDSVVRYAESRGLSRMELALAFGMQHPDIDVVLVGVSALREFEEVLQITRRLPVDLDFAGLGSSDEALLNPARWVTA